MKARTYVERNLIPQGSVVSFNCNQTGDTVLVNYRGEHKKMFSRDLVAMEAETLEDVEILNSLAQEIEKHKGIIVFKMHQGYCGYLFLDEAKNHADVVDSLGKSEIRKRHLYKEMAAEIAIEAGLIVYLVSEWTYKDYLITSGDGRTVGVYQSINDTILAFSELEGRND